MPRRRACGGRHCSPADDRLPSSAPASSPTARTSSGRGSPLIREVQGDYSYQSGRAAAEALVGDDVPDAVFCTSDSMAMGVLDARRADFPNHRPKPFPALRLRQSVAHRLRCLSDRLDRLRQAGLCRSDHPHPGRTRKIRFAAQAGVRAHLVRAAGYRLTFRT